MTKTNTSKAVALILQNHKVDVTSKLYLELMELVSPKKGGGLSANPSYEKDGVTYHHCRYLDMFLSEDKIVMSNNKSKGYSKIAIARWTKAGKLIQALNNEAMKLLLDGKTKEGKSKADEMEKLKLARNTTEYYSEMKKAMK